jgi:ELWxxDGT repeat protein
MSMRTWTFILAAFLFLPVAPVPVLGAAAAGPAYLVKDLKTGLDPLIPSDRGAVFYDYTAVNGRVVFFGLLPEGPQPLNSVQCGLWATDGGSGGTERLAPDFCGVTDPDTSRLRLLATNGAVAFFSDLSGRLWRTDGTAAGTYPLGDVQIQWTGNPPLLGPDGRTLFFRGCEPAGGCEPWRSDGTRGGTRQIHDLLPGPGSSNPSGFTLDGGRVLFTTAGRLWSTTATATVPLVQAQTSGPLGQPVVYGGRVYFVAYGGGVADLWVYDPATRRAAKLRSFPVTGQDQGLILKAAGGRLLIQRFDFSGGVQTLWETDGSRAGTRQIGPPFSFAAMSPPYEAGGRALFAAAQQPGSGVLTLRLWALAAGTRRPLPLAGCPGGCPTFDTDQLQAVTFGDRLFFAGQDPQHGRELWVSDGTGPGTRRVKDLCPGPCDGAPVQFRSILGILLFVDARGGLWKTDGTPAGTVRLAVASGIAPLFQGGLDVAPLGRQRIVFTGFDAVSGHQPWVSDLTPAGTYPIDAGGLIGGNLAASSWPMGLTALGGKVFFAACDTDTSGGLWWSDGSEAGTALLPGTESGSCAEARVDAPFQRAGGFVFYDWQGKLWRSDGTPGGTLSLLDFPGSLFARDLTELGGKLLFVVDPASFPPSANGWDWSFWTSDGTPAGTREAFPVRFRGTPGPFTSTGGEAFFTAESPDAPYPVQLWRTDGTEAGTRPLLSGLSGTLGVAPPAVRLGGRTFFLAEQAGRGVGAELWSTDGTAAGTVAVFPDPLGERPRHPLAPVVFQNALYFFALSYHPGDIHWALWTSDGTAAGTRILKTLSLPPAPVADGVLSPELTPIGDQLYFRADDGVHGLELWKTDGTEAGTVLVKDIVPGPATSRPDGLTAAGGTLYFTATDAEHGYELWQSDGTAGGTRMVQDIQPGPAPSNPDQLTVAAGILYFTATDGEHGRELWALPLPH